MMRDVRGFVACIAAWALTGCVSTQVRNGILIGAGSGAAVGAGVGLLVSDQNLLGSEPSPEKGDISLPTGEAVAASALIGAVFGGIVGGMSGHMQESPYGRPPPMPGQELESQGDEEAHADAQTRF